MPDSSEKPSAAGFPESGTLITISAPSADSKSSPCMRLPGRTSAVRGLADMATCGEAGVGGPTAAEAAGPDPAEQEL